MTAEAAPPAAASPPADAALSLPASFRFIPGQDVPSFELAPALTADVAPKQAAKLVRRRRGRCVFFFTRNSVPAPLNLAKPRSIPL